MVDLYPFFVSVYYHYTTVVVVLHTRFSFDFCHSITHTVVSLAIHSPSTNTIYCQLTLFSPLLSLAGLTGILFSGRSDVAYSAMRIWQAVGFTIGFVIAELLSFHHRVWILLCTVTIAAVVNLILEFLTQSKEELLPCIYRKRHRKSRDNSESSSVAATKEEEGEGSNTSPPKLDITEQPAMDHQYHLGNNSSVGQNPMFIMYGGRRPSTMSMWSADSLDGTVPSNSTDSATLATVNGGGMLLQQNGQNPLFVMYNGRRPSADSVGSYRLSERESGGSGRRLSAVSTTSADSLDGTRPLSASSRSESNPHHCEMVTTVPFVVGSDVPVRVLSPIHECEDDNEENPVITEDPSTSSSTIQRSNSYMSALDDTVAMHGV